MAEPSNIRFKPIVKLYIRLLVVSKVVRVHVDFSVINRCQLALCVHATNIRMNTAIVVKLISILLLHTFIIHLDILVVFKMCVA
jgi:hypothetical protein